MYVLKDMPKPIDAGLLKRLATVETATIGHFYHGQFVDPALRAVIPDRRVAGTAVTVAIPGPDSTPLHHVLGLVRPGDFLIVDRQGDVRHACWGGVVTQAAKAREPETVAKLRSGIKLPEISGATAKIKAAMANQK